ncbi:hypothetical protein COW36_15110 [bacterium (Candidatus Blackallbacteria) CG17_big_fil_post_rev_8_21_14_2_50_48_46]|uniref:Uncharacterized protein n=1 Tax=bacterium (Candidatus Blackallbacteria) CG17_big_fil_post_rev_8_21_14_2_50_48_46 TaxID=2014261 RepID=A0A2M7G305_9BACT|nr:MAG: hypothetical protein COW64_11440 [bacterium (Candidatus Blackallbacteria) CG18_big_fil_WC_8_21_14_2_50_49_26]PIW16039.1 MAG: hypothetical protein COW36_15110 [bacterium (Candidatus Blackallbacteria) CG17_big_fil_post_rev_8_21_14_2_50_48_46]PIW50451.1 MAG: hypothetical protein COW20_02825 [bacterium (Candidatus Blackallbacteria) CG13_big_fil_rev_8_21_14_2_50_49_14]
MKKLILALSACLIAFPASAATTLTPVSQASSQSVGGNQTLSETLGDVTVSIRPVMEQEKTQVFHPNGGGRISENFSPYAFKNVIQTQVFQVSIANHSSKELGASQIRLSVSFNGLPMDYLSSGELMRQWRHYYYLNTNTVSGAPDFMEQERAIVAEKFIQTHGFWPQDVPPGGEIRGYLAIPPLKGMGALKVKVRHVGQNPQDFSFHFEAKNS